MNYFRKMCIEHVFVLNTYLTQIIGLHYPKEIITHIVMINYKPIKISGGYNHTFLISDVSYCWGHNDEGQLGLKHFKNKCSPQKFILPDLKIYSDAKTIRDDVDVTISCGSQHTIALVKFVHSNTLSISKIYVWGSNERGRLGLGQYDYRLKIPQELIIPDSIILIKCGEYHTMALAKSGTIYGWGYNTFGQLGIGNKKFECQPQKLVLPEVITNINCGSCHTVALTNYLSNNSGVLYVWGYNEFGQLGLGDCESKSVPHKLILSEPIISVSCGGSHTVVITKSNNVYVWGDNKYGQLGMTRSRHTRSKNSPQKLNMNELIVSVSCGTLHTVALSKSGSAYAWGYNLCGRLGIEENNQWSPKKINLSNIIGIFCGEYHTLAITKNDTIYAWGDNNEGQLGLGHTKDQCEPCELKF